MLIRIRCYNCEVWNLYDFNDNQVGDIFECKDCKTEIANLTDKTKGGSYNEIYYVLVYATEDNYPYIKQWVKRTSEDDEFSFVIIPEDFTIGTPGAIRFDANKALKIFLEDRKLAGFYHEHPGSINPMPSSTDIDAMRSWAVATDAPLVWSIGNGRGLINTWIIWGEDGKDDKGKTITIMKSKQNNTLAEKDGGIFSIKFIKETEKVEAE